MEQAKNRLEHACELTPWDLSIQPDIQADCMECLSTDNFDLKKLVDEVVSGLHYPSSFISKLKSGEQNC